MRSSWGDEGSVETSIQNKGSRCSSEGLKSWSSSQGSAVSEKGATRGRSFDSDYVVEGFSIEVPDVDIIPVVEVNFKSVDLASGV